MALLRVLQCRWLVVLLLVVVEVSVGVSGREIRSSIRRNATIIGDSDGDASVIITDTEKIDNAVYADKLVPLFIFGLGGKDQITDGPRTPLVPQNSSLPAPGEGGFLTVRAATRTPHQNHAVLRRAVGLQPPQKPLTTQAESNLIITTRGDEFVTPDNLALFSARSRDSSTTTTTTTMSPVEEPIVTTTEELSTISREFALEAEENRDQPTSENTLDVFEEFQPSTTESSETLTTTGQPTETNLKTDQPIILEHEFNLEKGKELRKGRIDHETEILPEIIPSNSEGEKFNEALEMLPSGSSLPESSGVSPGLGNFFEWLKREVDNSRQLGGKQFLHHLVDSGVADQLLPGSSYTALVPTDEAFYEFYPIDWGFNPFLVRSFLRRTLGEHILVGDVDAGTLQGGEKLLTLIGTTLEVQRDQQGVVSVGGQRLLQESGVDGPYGRIYSVGHLIHVTHETVRQLHQMHPHLERAPLLGSPWPQSQFLSHLLQRTQELGVESGSSDTSAGDDAEMVGSLEKSAVLFSEYLALSHLSHLVSSADADLNRLEYTALVPTDASVIAVLRQGDHPQNSTTTPPIPTGGPPSQSFNLTGMTLQDPFLESADLRNRLVGSHILKGRLREEDLTPGSEVVTLLNDTLMVTRAQDGSIMIGGAKVIGRGESVYNLGIMYLVSGPLTLGGPVSPGYDKVGTPEGSLSSVAATEAKRQPTEVELLTSNTNKSLTPPRVVTRTEVSVSRRINNSAVERLDDIRKLPPGVT